MFCWGIYNYRMNRCISVNSNSSVRIMISVGNKKGTPCRRAAPVHLAAGPLLQGCCPGAQALGKQLFVGGEHPQGTSAVPPA